MTKKNNLYFHKTTGSIVSATKSQAKKLPEEYQKIEFIKNEEGVPVMRFRFNGATVDVSENGEQEIETNDNSDSK